MFSVHGPAEGSSRAPLAVLAELQQKGLVRHIGLSNVTPAQVAEARRMVPIVCVQNHYNVAHREDDPLIADLARDGIAYVPFLPPRAVLAATVWPLCPRGERACRHADAGCAGMALAALAATYLSFREHRPSNIFARTFRQRRSNSRRTACQTRLNPTTEKGE